MIIIVIMIITTIYQVLALCEACINSCTPPNRPIRSYYSLFPDEEIKAQQFLVLGSTQGLRHIRSGPLPSQTSVDGMKKLVASSHTALKSHESEIMAGLSQGPA